MVATESAKGLYELRDCKFNELPLSVLEWMAEKMGLEMPEKPPQTTGRKRSRARQYKRSLEVMIVEAFKDAYCFYLKGDRHYWVINGKAWYYSALNQFNLKGSCQEWNRSKYGQYFQIPESQLKPETIWIIMAEDDTDDIAPLYLLETMTSDRDYCELLKQEAATYPVCQGKTLTVVEALPEHLEVLGKG